MKKVYYVDIYGRANCAWQNFAGINLHSELVLAENHKDAKKIAWNHFQNDIDDFFRGVMKRRDFKIESEDVTGYFQESESDKVYFTHELLKL